MSGGLAAVLTIGFVLQAGTPSASALPCPTDSEGSLRPCELTVLDGEGTWHSDNTFALRWSNPPRDDEPPIAAVLYRALDSSGKVVLLERRIIGAAQSIERLPVPPIPGVYRAEVRLEDAAGAIGPPAVAALRFDDARPAAAIPLRIPSWINAAAFPLAVPFAAPTEEPFSGIRGYAVAVDRTPEGDPCAADDRCTETEIDLEATDDDRQVWLPELPEGTSYLHAAAVSGSGMKSTPVSHVALHVDATPPSTVLKGASGDWSSQPLTLVARAADSASGMDPLGAIGAPFTAIRVDGGAPIVAAGESAHATVMASGVHHVAYYARDAAGNVNDGERTNGRTNPAPAVTTIRIDAEPPRIEFINAQDPADPERIAALVHDSLSTPAGGRGQIAVRPLDSQDGFEALPTRAEDGLLSARWNSDAYPAGLYEFKAVGYDLAGNAGATLLRASGSRMVLSAPLKRPTSLAVTFVGFPQRDRAAEDAKLLRGRLRAGRGTPLSTMPLRLVERFDPGSRLVQRSTEIATDAAGNFAVRLAPGPSRAVIVAFAGTATLARTQSHPLRLAVPGAVRLRVSKPVARVGGRPVVFAGAVAAPGAEIPAGGKYVQLEFRLPGAAWTEFRTIRTDRRGRFRYAYRFSDDDSRGVRFQFRANAPAQSGWPYEPAGSRPVAVRGS